MNWKSCLVLTLGIAFGGCLSQPEVARESGTHYVADAMKEYLDKGILPGAISILKEETVKNVLALSSRPKGMDGYSLGLRAPVVDGEDWWVGHGGAFATNCMINWHRKALFMWVTQNGKEDWNFWYPKWEVAMKKFFGFPVDINAAYVGRVR